MASEDTLIQQMKEEIATLRECNRQLEKALAETGVAPAPLEWRLTASEARVFAVLVKSDLVTKDKIFAALYSQRHDDSPEPKIIDIFVCKLRAKVKPFGVVIDTVWGQGYALKNRESYLRGPA